MGYTHYWYRPKSLEQRRYRLLVADIRILLSTLPKQRVNGDGDQRECPLIIRGVNGKGQPEITEHCIAFNGDNEQGQRLGHEAMLFPRLHLPEAWERPHVDPENTYFQFCKTAGKPYDVLVCATLLAATFHFPTLSVESDGDVNDWAASVAWYCSCFRDRPLGSGPWKEER